MLLTIMTVVSACNVSDTGHLPDGPSALRDATNSRLPPPLISPDELTDGGPPPDGILPIDDPVFTSVDAADSWLTDADPVVYVSINDAVHVYPVQILIYHEIVNDTVGGVPVTVTYCPLCNSAVAYERVIDGVETTFGTSGKLYASALVMYDRATESLWTQINGQAIAGTLTGAELARRPAPLRAWYEVLEKSPDASVLDRSRTGSNLPYGENPYVGYDNPNSTPNLYGHAFDERLPAKQRVVGVAVGEGANAWTLESLSKPPGSATNATVGDAPIVILWRPGQVTALETARIVSGRDVGSIAVFDRRLDGRSLTFQIKGGQFVDIETGSQWDIFGAATAGPLAGSQLDPVPHLDTFWFAWSAYYPDTSLSAGG